MASPGGVEVHGPARDRYPDVLSDEALGLVAELQRELGPTREALLARRGERQASFDAGELPHFLAETAPVREGDWRVAPVEGIADRRVEITGPTDRKMLINALNSGARVFMADFEDANAPTWENMFGGQQNLVDAIEGTISFESPEARLWNDAFQLASDRLGIPRGTVKATVLIETITAAFEMDEILHELRDHSAGLNAGRWDYMFSVIKKFRNRPEFVLPDRNSVTMTVPFMRAYTQLLVKTCHRRGAFAMGGMSA